MNVNEIKSISIDITKKCNLSCGFCYLTGLKEKKISIYEESESFFPIGLFQKLIDEVSIMGDIRINFTGGEPFLHPGIFGMIDYAQRKGVPVFILTNGLMLDKKIISKIFFDTFSAPHCLLISVDGPEFSHDKIRGKGAYGKILESAQEITRRKYLLRLNRPRVVINTAINKFNIAVLSNMVSEAEKFGASQINFFYPEWSNQEISSAAKKDFLERLNWKDEKCRIIEGAEHTSAHLDDSEVEILYEEIDRIEQTKLYPRIKIKFSPDFMTDDKKNIKQWFMAGGGKTNCKSVFDYLRVDTDGSVCPICSFIYYPFGNLKNKSLEEILKEERAVNFFNKIRSKGCFSACRRCMRRDV